ncbi:MAG: hypothetical protein JWO52_7837 [Gammaproteobacteria bacterium]|nr:hypothetical protein [Gammaproteobacteria bacterium]
MSIALAQNTSGTGGFVLTLAQAYAGAVGAGSSLYAVFAYSDEHGSGITCADSVNGAWTAVGTPLHDTTNAYWYGAFKFDNTGAGTPTVTLTYAGNQPNKTGIWIAEVSGTSGYDTQAAQLVVSPGTATDAISSGAATPSSQPGLIIGAAICPAATTTQAAGTGFADNGAFWNFGSGDVARMESLRYTSLSALAATFTAAVANGTFTYGAIAALFKEGSPPAGNSASVAWLHV